jgi:hypothetical protein
VAAENIIKTLHVPNLREAKNFPAMCWHYRLDVTVTLHSGADIGLWQYFAFYIHLDCWRVFMPSLQGVMQKNPGIPEDIQQK